MATTLDVAAPRSLAWRRYLVAWAIVAAAILLLFHRDAQHLLHLWWNTSTFGHCLLIPPIIGWLVWQRRDGLAEIEPTPWLPGVGLMFVAGCGWVLGELAGVSLVRHAALVFMLQSSVLAIFGLTVARAVAFPLVYALFMVPIGEQLVPYLQTLTAHFSVWLLEAFGVPAFLDGVFISIPNGDFEIAEACSGVRFLIAMIAFSVLVANVCFRRWNRRIMFVAGAIATSILANGLRAWGIIYLASRSTPDVARGIDHVVYGWFFFAVVMGLVLAAGWPFFDRPVDDPFIDPRSLQPVRPPAVPQKAVTTAVVAAVFIAASGPAYAAWAGARGSHLETTALALPTPVGWSRTAYTGSEWTPYYAGTSATAMQSYRDTTGQAVELYVAVYDRQSEQHELISYGQGLIRPSNSEGGWGWAGSGKAPGGGLSAQINRGPVVRDVWQWYRVNGKILDNPYAAKVEGLKAKLLGGDPQAATVIVSAQRSDTLTTTAPALARFIGATGPVGGIIDRSIVTKPLAMCGIAGIFNLREPRPVSEPVLRRMMAAIAHRGPDGSDVWQVPGVALGHQRLAIIDLVTGDQPMLTEDGRFAIIQNGEVYNFREIRRDLEARGHRFRTNSDTEAMLLAYVEYGERCVEHFRGMFAMAIYDVRDRSLFLARDRLGVKPMHYAELPDGSVIFGSELKALLAHTDLRRDIDPAAIEDYFAYGYVPDGKCIIKGARKLAAGHTLTLRDGQPVPQPKSYWDIDFTTRHTGKADDLAHEMVDRVREAVALRMISDVPLGAFLSGGVDSSAVVAMMAGLTGQPVNTCSIGFDVAGYDETAYADEIAQRYGTNHRSRIVGADDFGLVDTLAAAYDEPFADASALPMYRVCQLARETVTVALSGDGADEAMGGYRRYRMHMGEERVRGLLPTGVRRGLFGPLGRAYPKLDWAPRFLRAKTTLESLGRSSAEAYFNSISVTPDRVRSHLFSAAFRKQLGGYRADALYIDTMRDAPASDELGRAQYADMKHWLPGDILTKSDRASMAVGLEAREPLLDHKLVEWEAGLPLDMRIRGGQGKWLLKKAMEPYVPQHLLYRPKMGFVVPISDWFRGALANQMEAIATDSPVLETGWFDRQFLKQAVADHRAGRADHGRLLWQILMLDKSLTRITGDAA